METGVMNAGPSSGRITWLKNLQMLFNRLNKGLNKLQKSEIIHLMQTRLHCRKKVKINQHLRKIDSEPRSKLWLINSSKYK